MKSLVVVFCLLYTIFAHAETSQEVADTLHQSKIDSIHSNFYAIYSTNFDLADSLTSWAIDYSKKKNWPKKTAYAELDKAVVTYLKGNYDQALPHFLESEHLFDSLQDAMGIGKINNEFAVFYHKQGQLDKAHACLDKSEQIGRTMGYLEVLGTSLGHRGAFLTRKGKYEEARPIFQEVLKIRLETKDSIGLGYVYLDLAEYAQFKGILGEAIKYINLSTEIREKIGDQQGLAINTVIMGETYYDAGNFFQAISYFEKTIELAKPIGYTDLMRFTYDKLEKSHIELDNYKDAYTYQLLSHELQDSLFNIERSKVIGELQTKYETEKKDLQLAEQKIEIQRTNIFLFGAGILIVIILVITFLIRSGLKRKQQLLIQQQEIELNKAQILSAISSQEKERFRYARDLHDGFGQMISLLNINLKGLETEKSREKRESIFRSASAVLEDMYKELRTICIDLMPQVLIRNGVDIAIREFATRINQSGKQQVEVDVFGMEERLNEVQEISIYRITQEWVNNILKHSDADKITIQLTKDEEEVTLLIEDNGSGFDQNKLSQGLGNGWKNLHSRANLINAKIELDIKEGRKGNTFILNIPVFAKSVNPEMALNGESSASLNKDQLIEV